MAGISYENFIGINNKLVETRILFLGRNETTKKVDLYAVGVKDNSDLSGLTKRYMNVMTENNYVYNNAGQIMGNMPSQQTAPEATLDLEFSIDYSMKNEKLKAGMSSNLLETIMLGKAFYKGNDLIRVIGTNGTLKSALRASKCDMNIEAGLNLFGYFNDNLETGGMDGNDVVFTYNSFRKPYEEVPFAIELVETPNDGKIQAQLLPYCSTGNTSASQADDTSKMTASVMRCCDIWDMENSLLSGQVFETAVTDLAKVNFEVDVIVQNATGVVPTDFGTNGMKIAVINKTTGAFTIHTSSGSAWTSSTVGGFVGKAIISAKKLTATTIATADDGRYFASVTAVGATNNAGFVVNTITDNSAKDFVYSTYTPNPLTSVWELFVEEGAIC